MPAGQPHERYDFDRCRHCHCLAARRAARAITRVYDARLRPFGLRATQFSVLAALSIVGASRVSALADALGLERTTLTRIAAVLERDGLIRTIRTDDARERLHQLTPSGRRRLERAYPAWKAAQEGVEREAGVRDTRRTRRGIPKP